MNLYKLIPAILCAAINLVQGQTTDQGVQQRGGYPGQNLIRSGFYLKLGPVFPFPRFSAEQVITDKPPFSPDTARFSAATVGGNLGLGYLIYLGPAVAGNHLRFGIDASFLDIWFATSKPYIPASSGKKEQEFWYYFVGQKFGPLVTINAVDRLMIDLSYKLNFNLSWHNSDWGYNITGQELMMNIRYRIIIAGIQYSFGKMNYNDLDKSRPDHSVEINNLRVLLGFKF